MFCTKCGKPIPQGAQFCPHCGAAQTTTTGAAQPVSNPVPQSSTYTPIPTALPEKPKVRPWIRFWARWIDINLISFLGAFALAFYYPELASVPSKDLILAVVVLFLWVFIESFLLSTAGTTPGKWLLNIHLTPPLGNKPDFSTAFSRSFDVWWRGLGLGLPFVTLFTNAAAYTNLKKNGITTWDRNGGFTVVHERVGLLKGGLAILFISGTLILFVLFSTNKSALIGSTSLTPSPTEENRRSFSIEEAYSTSLTPSPTEENTRPSQSEGFEAEYKAWQEKQLRKEIDAPVKSEQKPWERVYQAQGDNSNARRDAWVKEQMKDTEQEDARKKAWVNEQIKDAAEQGYAGAQSILGVMYYSGRGMPQDYAQALKWCRKAAEQGLVDAQYNLGVMYDNGQGVPQDDAQAFTWYRKAAEQGFAKAQYNLGVMYDNGQGVPQDNTMAYVLYNLAAASGVSEAVINRDKMAKRLFPKELSKAQAISRSWKPGMPLGR